MFDDKVKALCKDRSLEIMLALGYLRAKEIVLPPGAAQRSKIKSLSLTFKKDVVN